MLDVGIARLKRVNLGLVDVEPNHFVADFAIPKHQGQADIAQAHDADSCAPAVQLFD
jgi:hypothetical protein